MRVCAVATILLLSSSLIPGFAQEAGKPQGSNQPELVPVQPDRSPQQSQQSREEDRDRGNLSVGRDWRVRRDDSADRDGYGRGSHEEDRPRRRVKICFEYENGDEYCRYR
jgi:hypothetical protein